MKEISRENYLKKLINSIDNGLIKVITGLRRSGKSYLLFNIFKNYLLSLNVKKENIITFSFENEDDIDKLNKYYEDEPTRIKNGKLYIINSKKFRAYINDLINNNEKYFILLDEIQLLDNFVGTLNTFLSKPNLDTYVTGSNSYMLSNDIITTFRGRSYNIFVYPLSFKEYYSYLNSDKEETLNKYLKYGGLPLTLNFKEDEDIENYLKNLFDTTYLKDIKERNDIKREDIINNILDLLSSSISSLTNPKRIHDYLISHKEKEVSINTIISYLTYLENSYLIKESKRYDIKGKEYLSYPNKYYFQDLGLRNARLNFRNNDKDHLLENLVYNELLIKGYEVDVGALEINEKRSKKTLEVDFLAQKTNKKFYIQVTLSLSEETKRIQEKKSLLNIKDNFPKIIITLDKINPYFDENGIYIINIFDFLLNDDL